MTEQEEHDTSGDNAGDTLPAKTVDVDHELAMFVDYANQLPTDDPAEVQERILRALLTATSPEEILRAGEAVPASDVLNIPMTIMDVRGSESTYVDGMDIYLHVDAKVKSNGDSITFSCGSRDVVTKLIRLHQLHMLPIDAVLKRADKPTKDGYYPTFLRMIDKDDQPF